MGLFGNSTDEINSKIATLKTVSEKASVKYKKKVSDINNLMDSILSIYNQLGGYEDMIKSIEDVLSNKLEDIENTIKSSIKIALKEIISCGIEPSIDDLLILTGVTFDIKKVDPLSIFAIDPTSENGSYAYFNNHEGIKSLDFNVFLYTIIKNSSENTSYTGATWNKIENDNTKTPLFKASFKEFDQTTNKSNQLTIKIDEIFRGKKLSFFISQYLDSVKLFNNIQIISSIFDDLLGTKILSANKTSEQLKAEKLISNIVDKIINNIDTEDDVIDDSFYIFSNDEYNQMMEESENKKNGVFVYNKSTNDNLSINQELLLKSINELKTDGLLISKQTKILTDTIDTITKDLVDKGKIENKNSFSFKFDFIRNIIKKLVNAITLCIFSPKIIFLFSMTSRIYGLEEPSDVVKFIKSNINIYKKIIIKIRDIILQELIDKIKEMLAPLLAKIAIELAKEKYSIYKKQLNGIKDAISGAIGVVSSLKDKIEDERVTITDKAEQIKTKTL